MDNITLIGMPGSGKSTSGVVLAKRLGFNFLDTDLVLQHREGARLQQLLGRLGLEGFLDAESAAVCSVDCHRTVIAPGGSVVYRKASMEHLRSLGQIVYLYLPLEQLRVRINNMATRGIAMGPDQTLESLYAQREPLYRRYADMILDCSGQSLEQTVQSVLDALPDP